MLQVCTCYLPSCEACAEIADQIYRLQHPAPRICTGCGNDENHTHATTCQTCMARYRQIIAAHIGQEVTLFSQDTALMICGVLHYHCNHNYTNMPTYLRPLCVEKMDYAYLKFMPHQVVNVHTFTSIKGQSTIQITVKL